MNIHTNRLSFREHHLPTNGGVLTKQSNGGIIARGGILTLLFLSLAGPTTAFAADTETPAVAATGDRGRTVIRRSKSCDSVRRLSRASASSTSPSPTHSPSREETKTMVTRVTDSSGNEGSATGAGGPVAPDTPERDRERVQHRIFEAPHGARLKSLLEAAPTSPLFSGAKQKRVSIDGADVTGHLSNFGLLFTGAGDIALPRNLQLSPLNRDEQALLRFTFAPALAAVVSTKSVYPMGVTDYTNPCIRDCHSAITGAPIIEYRSIADYMIKPLNIMLSVLDGRGGVDSSCGTPYNAMWWVMKNLPSILARYVEIGGAEASDMDVAASIVAPLIYKTSGRFEKGTDHSKEKCFQDVFQAPGRLLSNRYFLNKYMLAPLLASLLVVAQHALEHPSVVDSVRADALEVLRVLNQHLLRMNGKVAHLIPAMRDYIESITMEGTSPPLSVLQAEPIFAGLDASGRKRTGDRTPTTNFYPN